MLLKNGALLFRHLSWKTGDILTSYYGPLIWISGLLFLITNVSLFLWAAAFFLILFIIRAVRVRGAPWRALLWPLRRETPKAVPLALKDGSVADLYLHENPGAPCLIFLFGGGFISGNPQQYALLNAEWVQLGFHVIQVPYPYWPEAKFDRCLTTLLGRIEQILNHRNADFSPQSFVLGGRSAGGYLAYYASSRISDPKLKAVLGFYPISQPDQWRKEWPSKFILPTEKIYKRFFLGQSLPADLLSISSFPAFREYWILSGAWDPVVLPRHSRRLLNHLKSTGCKAQLFEIPTELHGFECNPNSFGGQRALSLIRQQLVTLQRQR